MTLELLWTGRGCPESERFGLSAQGDALLDAFANNVLTTESLINRTLFQVCEKLVFHVTP